MMGERGLGGQVCLSGKRAGSAESAEGKSGSRAAAVGYLSCSRSQDAVVSSQRP